MVKFSSEGLKKISFKGTPIVPKNDGRRNGIENEAKASKFIKFVCQITAQVCDCSKFFKTGEKIKYIYNISFFGFYVGFLF